MKKLVRNFWIRWPSEEDANRAVRTFEAARLTSGLGPLDALIGETARGADLPLYTFNAKHFKAVPGLATLAPYKRP